MATQYTVKKGDTLSKIGQQYGVDYNQISGYKSGNPNMISIGEVLNIPNTPTTPITADGLTPVQQANVQPFQDKTDYSIGGFDLGTMTGETSEMDKLFKDYMGTQTAPSNPADTYNTLYDQSGVADKETALLDAERITKAGQAKLAGISAQLQGLNLETEQRKLKIGQEAISAGAMQGRNIEEERNLAIRSLPLQAQAYVAQAEIATAQGNQEMAQTALTQAQGRLDKAFEMQTNYETALVNWKNDMGDKMYDIMTKDQQRRWEEKKLLNEQALSERKDILSTMNNLAQTYPDAGISPTDTLEQAQKKAARSPSFLAKQKADSSIPTVKSGGLVVPESAIVTGQQKLDESRGDDGYVYTPLYLELLEAWKEDGGLLQDFLKKYPPKDYLNPNDDSIPTYIKDKLKTVEDREL